MRDMGSIPGWGGNGNPFQYSCLENSMDREAWRTISSWSRKELDTTEWLHFHFLSSVHVPQSMGSQRVRHNWARMTEEARTHTHNGLCKYQISLERHWGGPVWPEKKTFPLPQGKGSNLSRAFLASRLFLFFWVFLTQVCFTRLARNSQLTITFLHF